MQKEALVAVSQRSLDPETDVIARRQLISSHLVGNSVPVHGGIKFVRLVRGGKLLKVVLLNVELLVRN